MHIFNNNLCCLHRMGISMFRKALALLMTSLMLISFASCSVNEEVQETDTDKEEITAEQQTTVDDTTASIDFSEKTIQLNSQTQGVKILCVRNLESNNGINADWTCSGIEFL